MRNPSDERLRTLIKNHDIVHSNGTSTKLFLMSKLAGKPFTWTHHGYQLSCIDGAGWAEGQAAPMTPWASTCHHMKLYGISKGLQAGAKLYLRRLIAKFVSANIASSEHLNERQPLPNQVVIYNPIDVSAFLPLPTEAQVQAFIDTVEPGFFYVGRLISEKGVDDLIMAFKQVLDDDKYEQVKLTIIGSGPEEAKLKSSANIVEIGQNMRWSGNLSMEQLSSVLRTTNIGVIPSKWEEPGALIVMLLLSQGKPLIVAKHGWLSECAQDACITFENGDKKDLANAMRTLLADKELQKDLSAKAIRRFKQIQSADSTAQYLKLFKKLSKG
jgi:glycosyltransferase involved in cell wall biosynthesis